MIKKFTLIILSVLVLFGAGCSSEKNENSNTLVSVSKPCNYSDLNSVDNKGLQCFFLNGTSLETGSGIWIKPVINSPGSEPYSGVFEEWKTYTSPDKSFSFKYPRIWQVVGNLWSGTVDSQGLIYVAMTLDKQTLPNSTNSILIEKIRTNNIIDIINNQTKGSSVVLQNQTVVNNSQAVRLDIAPNNNLGNQKIVLIIKTKEYYLVVSAFKYNNPFIDFPTEVLLRTIKVK